MQASSSQLVCNPALSVPTTDGLMSAYSGPDTMIGSGVVTLMIRRLPRTYTPSDVRAEIESVVPSYAYNYVYHPWDIQRRSNSNYAFVNFVSSKWAMRVFLLLSGKSCRNSKSPTECRISKALLQGLSLNLANYVISHGIMIQHHNEPVVFTSDHQQVDFRLAVKTFCTPEDFCAASMLVLRKLEGQGHAAAFQPMGYSEWEILAKDMEDHKIVSERAPPQGYTSSHSNNLLESIHFQTTVFDNSIDPGSSSGTSAWQKSDFNPGTQLGQLSNPTLSGHSICQNETPGKVAVKVAFANPESERLKPHTSVLKDLKVAGILSHEFVQHSANGIKTSAL